ncbi:MAG TPA: methyltransferase [Sphingomicrobium sp.]|jgi:predicted methyltransferase|nr:methyltransferase [Sphingomicrobium sp.]
MRKFTLVVSAIVLSIGAAQAAPSPKATTIAAAVSSPDRNADNVKLDEGRKPTEVLQFLGLKPGMHVLDLFGGNAYWAEIMAPVVGPKGQDTVWEPTQFYSDKTKASFASFQAKHSNVSIVSSPFEKPDLPKNYADFVILNDNYHDTYWQSDKYGIPKMDPNAFLKAVYDSMKPGGVIAVIDHAANPNDDTRATVEKLHRIDPKVVKADFKRAGFVFVKSSDVLHNAADDHSLLVFDPKVRGKTDRFVFEFRKPR